MAFNLDDYEPVASRLDRWLKANTGTRVITDLVHYHENIAVFKCELWLDDRLIATGWAEEIRGQGNVNKTSHLENCETGAVGRALANAGLSGSDYKKRPSREEMLKVANSGTITSAQMPTVTTESGQVIQTANSSYGASDAQKRFIKSLSKQAGKLPPIHLDRLTTQQASALIKALQEGETMPEPPEDTTLEDPF
jgi:hypothetical protein